LWVPFIWNVLRTKVLYTPLFMYGKRKFLITDQAKPIWVRLGILIYGMSRNWILCLFKYNHLQHFQYSLSSAKLHEIANKNVEKKQKVGVFIGKVTSYLKQRIWPQTPIIWGLRFEVTSHALTPFTHIRTIAVLSCAVFT